jgi:hypothetical protein
MSTNQIPMDRHSRSICPRHFDPAHRAIVAITDHIDRKSFDNVTEELVLNALPETSYMDLRMVTTVTGAALHVGVAHGTRIEAWFFECPTCGFILPAGRAPF